MHRHRQITVVHQLPGRTRLDVRKGFWDREGAARLTRHLLNQNGIHRVRASHRSGRLLVHHDRSLSMTKLLDLVREGLEVVSRMEGSSPDAPDLSAPEPEDQAIHQHFSRVSGVGGLILYLLMRRKVKGPSRLAASPLVFNLMAATALTAGYPNIKNGLRYFTGRRTAGHDLLLSLSTLTVLFMGEGFLGLTVMWLVNVTDMVQALLWRKTRQAFSLPERGPRDRKPDQLTEAARDYAERAAATALIAGAAAGLAARDFRRILAVLLAANPSAAGHVAPAALTSAAARAGVIGVRIGSRRDVAALALVDTLVIPGTGLVNGGDLTGLDVVTVPESRALPDRVEHLQARGARVAVLGRGRGDLEGMRRSDLAVAAPGATADVLKEASVFLSDAGSLPEARRLAGQAVARARGALTFVRLANLTGLVLAGAGWLPPARGTVAANLTSLVALLIAMHSPASHPTPVRYILPVHGTRYGMVFERGANSCTVKDATRK
ncbi:MAG: hypothetical protein M0Z41_17300 [Peptococcaceae bacterium]|jgi:cation transport ATPase|nr:hypothetical protein [Peptococcaceae bacterium]